MALQGGSYEDVIKAATRFYTGHAQINQRDFVTDSKLEQTIGNAAALRAQLENRSFRWLHSPEYAGLPALCPEKSAP